jgi:hypothetical protein
MRRLAIAGLLALLIAVVFAQATVAKMHDDKMMMHNGNPMSSASASAMSTASAPASAMFSSSAMSSSSVMGNKMMSASALVSPLPRTGGMPLMPLLSAAALALVAGSGIVAARLVRRST